jgi:hypothetical protein
MSKTIATTIKADVVIYQDGSVEVVTDTANHASGEPAVITLNEIGALHARRCFTPDELANAGMRRGSRSAENTFFYETGERLGYEWVRDTMARGELDRVADLHFDYKAREQQAGWSVNTLLLDSDNPRWYMVQGWLNGFMLAVLEALNTVPGWIEVYDRHKALNAAPPAEVEYMY